MAQFIDLSVFFFLLEAKQNDHKIKIFDSLFYYKI